MKTLKDLHEIVNSKLHYISADKIIISIEIDKLYIEVIKHRGNRILSYKQCITIPILKNDEYWWDTFVEEAKEEFEKIYLETKTISSGICIDCGNKMVNIELLTPISFPTWGCGHCSIVYKYNSQVELYEKGGVGEIRNSKYS